LPWRASSVTNNPIASIALLSCIELVATGNNDQFCCPVC
jgi:hypothetical protein